MPAIREIAGDRREVYRAAKTVTKQRQVLLAANYSKTNYIIFTKKRLKFNFTIKMDDQILKQVNQVKYMFICLNALAEKGTWGKRNRGWPTESPNTYRQRSEDQKRTRNHQMPALRPQQSASICARVLTALLHTPPTGSLFSIEREQASISQPWRLRTSRR